MTPLLSAVCLALPLLTTAALVPGEPVGAPTEDQLLDKEGGHEDFDRDDTSLLQMGLRNVPPESDKQGSAADIPEASFAWALYQKVPDGPPRPWSLANGTMLEPPGIRRPHQTAMLKAAAKRNHTPAYLQPLHPDENTPFFMFVCFGRDYDYNKYSSWWVTAVSTPQLVPFIVPMDHPNRSDVSVVIAPGGGGTFLAWESEGTDVAKWFNLLGISAFVLKYRVPVPEVWDRVAQVMDAQRAVSLVRHVAPALGLNASRVGLWGASAGGGLALLTAFASGRQYERRDVVDDQSAKPDFLLLLYPQTWPAWFQERGSSSSPTKEYDGVTLGDLSDPPPIFAAQGAADTCCTPDGLYDLHMALAQRGTPTLELNIYDNIGHGFTMCWRSEMGGWEAMQHEACMWMSRARRFIMWQVEKKTPANIEYWYRKTLKFETSLVSRKVSIRKAAA